MSDGTHLYPRIGDQIDIFVSSDHFEDFIYAKSSNTIREIKEMIEGIIGVPPHQQALFWHPRMRKMEDDETLQAYTFNGFIVLLLLGPSMKLMVKIPEAGHNFHVSLEVFSSDSVSSIKDKIFRRFGVPLDRQVLLYRGKPLEDDRILSSYNIRRNDIISDIIGMDEEHEGFFELIVRTIDSGEEMLVMVKKWFTILQVKAVIESSFGIPICLQELLDARVKLHDWKTVQEYKLNNRSLVYLNLLKPRIRVVIKMKNPEQIILFEALASNTIDSLIENIPQEEILKRIRGLPGLFIGDFRLMGDNSLASYGILDGTVLELDRYLQINVKMHTGEMVKVDVKGSDTVLIVKEKIEALTGIYTEMQELTYRGDEIDHFMTLEQIETWLGTLWKVKWRWNGKEWSFFWPVYA